MTCTWKDCDKPAEHPLVGKDGTQWANACDAHFAEFNQGIESGDARLLLRNWIRAQGGAKVASERMKPACEVAGRMVEFLSKMKGQRP